MQVQIVRIALHACGEIVEHELVLLTLEFGRLVLLARRLELLDAILVVGRAGRGTHAVEFGVGVVERNGLLKDFDSFGCLFYLL